MKLLGLFGAVVVFGVCHAAVATAQEQIWLKDRRYAEGMGIRTGDLELHPGVAAEFGYDSNYLLRAGADYAEPIVDVLRLRLTPSFSLSTLSHQRREGDASSEPPKVNFRAGVAASYNHPIALQSGYDDSVSKHRNVGGLANFSLGILPGRPWNGDFYGDFMRTIQPSSSAESNYNRLTSRGGAGLVWAPGGGMFDWRLGYEFGHTYFEDEGFRNLSNYYNQLNTRGRWRFLPRTALMYDGHIAFYRYQFSDSTRSLLPSSPVRARIGVNGLVTSSFALLAMVGWGASFYDGVQAQQFDSVIGQAELKWFITPNPSTDPAAATLALSSLAVGYTRDFVNSYIGDYYRRDRGYLRLSHFFGGRFVVAVDGGLAAHSYPNVFFGDRSAGQPAHAPFTALSPDATLFSEYRVADSVGINGTLRYSANITDAAMAPGGPASPQRDRLQWTRFEAFLGVRWFL